MSSIRSYPALAQFARRVSHPFRAAARCLRTPFQPRLEALEERAVPATIAYQVPAGTVGQQAFTGPLGMDFDVNQPVVVTKLGVFDSGSDGLAVPLTARLYNRDTQAEVTELTFAAGQTGTLVGGSRFLPLPAPVLLPAGFHGTIVAEGYSPSEPDGNFVAQPITWTTNDGGGLLSFVGSSRFGFTPGAFPTNLDSGPAGRYAAGTFTFEQVSEVTDGPSTGTAGLPYVLHLDLGEATAINQWTVQWGDGHQDVLPGNPPQATHTYGSGGTFTITATADEGAAGTISTSTMVTVTDPNPTAALAGPTDGVRGQPLAFTFSATSPSAAEQAAGFTYSVSWGDGSPDQTVALSAGNGAGVTVSHVFTDSGTFPVTLTATDQDGHASAPVSQSITITPWAIQTQPDPANPGQTLQVLVVGGSQGDDRIHIVPGPGGQGIEVRIFEKSSQLLLTQVFTAPVDRIVVYGQDGNDRISVANSIMVPAELFGGNGDDTLSGGGGDNVLVGGGGNDVLYGGLGRNVLIGGGGSDLVIGGPRSDLLISGRTDFDPDAAALGAILAEWASADDYGTRIAHLLGTTHGGLNRANYLTTSTVHDDGRFDLLIGGCGRDWFIVGDNDWVLDRFWGERVTQIS
jgi:Ca2+-binding RTX toxin-like protein